MSNYYDQASLVLVPSGYKDQKLYSQKPQTTAGQFLFNRGSDLEVTRVNSQGKIEKAILNGLLQSNTFSTTWLNSNSSEAGGQADKDGGTDAWKITAVGTGSGRKMQQFLSTSGVISFSVYAKAGTAPVMGLEVAGTGGFFHYFNLSTGAIGSGVGSISKTITAVGNGYYRCTITGNASAISSVNIFVCDADGSTAVTDGAYLYIQDAQLNYGLVAQTYVETTTAAVISGLKLDTPRLNYDPANPTCPSLLLEKSSTNLVTQSEYIADSSYTKTNATVSTNTAIAPDGTLSASTVASTATNGFIQGVATVSSGVVYTMSVWLKRKTGTGGVQLRGATNTSTTVTITDEWARYSVTLTANDVYGRYGVLLNTSGDEVYAWGFQLEASSYPTSYIPTYGSSATRNGELALGGNVNIFNSSEGTLFLDFKAFKDDTSFRYIALSDGTVSNRVTITLDSQYRIQSAVSVGGVTQSNVIKQMSSASLSEGFKIAMTYKNNEFKSFVNGVETTPRDTSGNTFPVGTLKYLRLNQGNTTSNPLYGNVNKILVFNTALSDTELATLTSL